MGGRYAGAAVAAPPDRAREPRALSAPGRPRMLGGAGRPWAPGPSAGRFEEADMTEQAEHVDQPQARGPRVVVGVDGSAGGRGALRFALEDAARRGVPLGAVLAPPPPPGAVGFGAVRGVP